ncbi:hypothetical protein INT44_003515 [Umbelopsis vinacea]|uniref:F-box domain-containing protein n=1 Tax=Umbelopsis vinacea TaxID=44442 RepID=A0A8H7PWK7_9FUNG|nr:hypothetical protein INT44_003515 [Umbelopsis vinacea]
MSNISPLICLPDELLIQICSDLDILTIFALADSGQIARRRLLSISSIWQKITFDPTRRNLHTIYATLRRFRDDNNLNHLRPIVESVTMDGFDDPMISPIVMLVKFPNLRHIAARNRRYTTSIETDTKVLHEFLNSGKISQHSLKLETYQLYHPYMIEERTLRRFQSTLNALAVSGSVELDIRQCSHISEPVPIIDDELDATADEGNRQAKSPVECRRIIRKGAKCWACGEPEEYCYQCIDKCANCGLRRLPPFVNDVHVLEAAGRPNNVNDNSEDMFSVFE